MPLPISNLCWGFMWIFEKGNKSTKIILVISVNIFLLLCQKNKQRKLEGKEDNDFISMKINRNIKEKKILGVL